MSSVLKTASPIILSLTILLGLGLSALQKWIAQPVLFASLESKNSELDTVYNKIRMMSGWNQDTWIMRQSHHGKDMIESDWDSLAIVVDKSSSVAKFYQLASGDEADASKWIPAPLKIRCHLCHANGPRAIRPDADTYGLTRADRLKILLLNARIKLYGPLRGEAGQQTDEGEKFQSSNHLLQRPLNLESCNKCHNSDRIRSELTAENVETAKFLVEMGEMPPFPWGISESDRRQLKMAFAQP